MSDKDTLTACGLTDGTWGVEGEFDIPPGIEIQATAEFHPTLRDTDLFEATVRRLLISKGWVPDTLDAEPLA